MSRFVLPITVPFAKSFSNYHEIEGFADSINEVVDSSWVKLNGKLKSYEYAPCVSEELDGVYIGLFYVGKRPSRSAIREIVKQDCSKE